MHALATTFLVGVLASSSVALFFVHNMASQLQHVQHALFTDKRAFLFLLQDLPKIVREHSRLFPVSDVMLGFCLSLIYLMISLSCMVYCTVVRL